MAAYWYRKIDAWAVPWDARSLARRVLRYAERDLTLEPISIQWVEPVSEEQARKENWKARIQRGSFSKLDLPCLSLGMKVWAWINPFREGELFLRVDVTPEIIVQAVLHESRHLCQSKHYRPALTAEEVDVAERDADDYAAHHYNAAMHAAKGGNYDSNHDRSTRTTRTLPSTER